MSLRLVGCILMAMSFLAGCTITQVSTPTLTPTSASLLTNTPDPCTGWWCTVKGVVYVDTIGSGNELDSASVKLGQFSYCSPTSGQRQTTTGPDGTFEFGGVFFHDTDRVWIEVESEGYESTRWDSTDFYCFYCTYGLCRK